MIDPEKIAIDVNTQRLTREKEIELYDKLDDLRFELLNYSGYDSDDLELSDIDSNGEVVGIIKIRGYATDDIYGKIEYEISGYDVDYRDYEFEKWQAEQNYIFSLMRQGKTGLRF